MIVTQGKAFSELLDSLKSFKRIFLVGCGECATTCKTGSIEELNKAKSELEANNKIITGMCVPSAPCVASQVKAEFAKNMASLRQSEVLLVFACGLGVQSVKDNDRLKLEVLPALNSVFGAAIDAQGNLVEKCSFCGECLLGVTCGICPVTLCPKGLLNGPCGGMNKGKCEVDKDRDCAWVLIYNEAARKNKQAGLKVMQPAKDFKKATRPRKFVIPQAGKIC